MKKKKEISRGEPSSETLSTGLYDLARQLELYVIALRNATAKRTSYGN